MPPPSYLSVVLGVCSDDRRIFNRPNAQRVRHGISGPTVNSMSYTGRMTPDRIRSLQLAFSKVFRHSVCYGPRWC